MTEGVGHSRRWPRRASRSALLWLLGLLPVATALGIWQVSSTDDARSFPRPSSWWASGRTLWDSGDLAPALRSTLTTFALSMIIATAIGILLGAIIGYQPRLERALTPLIDFFRTLPPPVVVPVLTLLLGITRLASVAIVVIAVVWPVVLNTMNAVHEMPSVRREIAPVLGVGRLDAFLKISLPSLTSGIVVGVRSALSLAVVVTLLVDIIGSGDGIGRLLVEQQETFEAPAVWALLFLIGVVGYLLNLLVAALGRVLLRNHPARPAL